MHVPASAAFPGSLDEGRTAVSGSFLGVPAVSKHTRTTQASPPPRRPISVCVYIERDPPPSRRMPRRASREQVVFGRDGVSPHSHALRFAAEVTLETALCSAGEQGPGVRNYPKTGRPYRRRKDGPKTPKMILDSDIDSEDEVESDIGSE
ncbi:uncharacterized protein TRAVEDRAFT_49522 [Trametes versicolor FP-101664 SS1]|uniref:uncharacterized protein n=1 Tax=Trametes versicolor (strain FP-101664) TaxID=717944 RepID=UPI0004623525|nr:uncharacterized protein TRAVEDRAFT_49522 [Trametes versicolor FP-101664 SS1]EIW56703.1 hypothetical protein TRAVEDRAFT_49522 [Trametes versicolor FP-101664 SS1]